MKDKFESYKKVYAYCLAGVVTGGCELIHQLIDYLNNHGVEAYIVYVGKKKHEIPQAYSGYYIKVADEIDDSESSIIVAGEGFFYKINTIKHAQILLWWLSVDNVFIDGMQLPFISLFDILRYRPRAIVRWAKLRFTKRIFCPSFSIKGLAKKNCINGYQSEYARLFLKDNDFDNIVPLKDYINTIYFTEDNLICKKEDQVLFNPRKGFEFTSKLINAAPDIKWVPIQNMNREQVQETMRRSKVYIDFGYHPGKDRLPREAALNGCCIITGRRGAAANDIDISIPAKYKFDDKTSNVVLIIEKIRDVFDDYNSCHKDFKDYVNRILEEKEEFESQIDSIFSLQQ